MIGDSLPGPEGAATVAANMLSQLVEVKVRIACGFPQMLQYVSLVRRVSTGLKGNSRIREQISHYMASRNSDNNVYQLDLSSASPSGPAAGHVEIAEIQSELNRVPSRAVPERCWAAGAVGFGTCSLDVQWSVEEDVAEMETHARPRCSPSPPQYLGHHTPDALRGLEH